MSLIQNYGVDELLAILKGQNCCLIYLFVDPMLKKFRDQIIISNLSEAKQLRASTISKQIIQFIFIILYAMFIVC
jgi:hypothetical protein